MLPSMNRTNWSRQSQRLWDFLMANPNKEFPTPELSRICAGGNGWSSTITKRCSEVQKRAREQGYDFLVTRDEWVNGSRHTARTFFVPPKE